MLGAMRKSRQPDPAPADEPSHAPAVPAEVPHTPSSKTLQELERLQFDQLDRTGFDR